MRKIAKTAMAAMIAAALAAPVSAQPTDPAAVMDRYTAAINAGDVEGALALVAEDAVYDRPGGRFVGKDAVRGFVTDLIARDAAVELIGERTVEGSLVSWQSRVTIDDPQNPDGPRLVIMNRSASVVVDGLIVMHTAEPANSAATPADALYIGPLPGTEALIAIARSGDHLIAYVCDGTPTDVSLWGWFNGEITDGRADMVSTNGMFLHVILGPSGAAGVLLSREGEPTTFSLESATGDARFWRMQGVIDGDAILGGWILASDGEQRGSILRNGTVATAAHTGGVNATVEIEGSDAGTTTIRLATGVDGLLPHLEQENLAQAPELLADVDWGDGARVKINEFRPSPAGDG